MKKLIKELNPQSIEWAVLRSELLVAQDKLPEAQKLLDERAREVPELSLWLKSAQVLRLQKKLDDAGSCWMKLKKSLGDSVALRLDVRGY